MENEIKILRSFSHPALIRLDSVYENEKSVYLIFEILLGGNLKDYIKEKGILEENQASILFKHLLQGIKYLHQKNIMHRDIKPENIMIRNNGALENPQLVLADFGLATYNDVSQYLFSNCGTLGFVAPEILTTVSPKDHYSLKCDLFSCGVTLYYALTGELPYNGENLIEENRKGIFNLKKSSKFHSLSIVGR